MRRLILGVAVLAVAVASDLRAQTPQSRLQSPTIAGPPCVKFAPNAECRQQQRPSISPRQDSAPAPQLGAPALLTLTMQDAPVVAGSAIDCAMIRTPNPNFRSAMPIVKPDPAKHYAMTVTQAPPCPTPQK